MDGSTTQRRGGGGRLLLSVCTLAVVLSCGRSPEVTVRTGPNVLLVVLDACRADKLGSYGFERPTSPAIDGLAEDPDGVLFERYYVQASWTKPSTASLFTGLFVEQHRAMVGRRDTPTPERLAVLSDGFRTLAEAFEEAGYATLSFTENHQLNPAFGFDQGFTHYEMVTGGDRKLAQTALTTLEASERPFFAYVHFVGCHYPFPAYLRDREYLERYGPPSYDEVARQNEGVDFTSPAMGRQINRGDLELEPDDVVFLNAIYEAKLRHLDRTTIAPLLDGLKRAGLYDDTLILLTADHGEELYEHRGFSHGHALWEEVLRVPLILKFPRGRRPEGLPSRFAGLASSIDLFPTLAAFAGLEAPDGLPGRDLLAAERGRFAFAQKGLEEWTLIEEGSKAILTAGERGTDAAGRPFPRWRRHLYDLTNDPGETENLIESRRADFAEARQLVERLRERYSQVAESGQVVENPELSEEAIENLRSLGYVE